MRTEGNTQEIEDIDQDYWVEEDETEELDKRAAAREVIRMIRASKVKTIGEAAELLLDLEGDAYYGIYMDLTDPLWNQTDPALEAIAIIRVNYLY